MKMTVELDDRLIREVEAYASQEGKTIAGLAGRVPEDYVRGNRRRGSSSSFVPLIRKSCPAPGVDVDNLVALCDRMDGFD